MRRNPPSRRTHAFRWPNSSCSPAHFSALIPKKTSGVCHHLSLFSSCSLRCSRLGSTPLSRAQPSSSVCLHCYATLPSSPPLAFPCKMRPSRDHGEAAGVPTPTITTATAPHPLCPTTPAPHGPLRQLRGKGHPEERAPPRRPQ